MNAVQNFNLIATELLASASSEKARAFAEKVIKQAASKGDEWITARAKELALSHSPAELASISPVADNRLWFLTKWQTALAQGTGLRLTLNVGLNTSQRYAGNVRKLTSSEVIKKVSAVFNEHVKECDILHTRLQCGENEDTLIAALAGNFANAHLAAVIAEVAAQLQQECIAYRVRDSQGVILAEALAGQYASLWGDFNSDFFYE